METTEFLDPVVDFPLDIDLALSELFQNDSEDDPQDEPPAEADGRRPSIESTGSVAPVSQDGYIFKSWMRSVRSNRTHVLKPRRVVMSWPDENTEEGCLIFARNEPETLPDTVSDTSSAPVKNMETASFSQATLSVAGRARTNTVTSTKYSTSVFSNSEAARASIDSNRLTTSVSLDEAAWNRAVQRRQILQELVGTETVYVSGLRALGETGIGRSVGTLLRLHSTFLDALRIAVPRVPTATFAASMKWMVGKKASKQSSTDCHRKSVTSRRMREPVEHRIRSRRNIAAEPNEAQKVAEILMSKLPKFKIYEEYGVKYHLVSQEIEELRKTVDFQMWDNGTEALSRSLAPRECQELSPNQALTIGDLLAKPIQRVCKYQLFLSDLLKCTPSSDCPAAHEALEMVHQCMIDTVQEINRATGDPVAKDRMAKTILLRNRLDFTGFGRDRDILREFGPIKACGVLHITYEATESIAGEYMACALFASHIILAVPRTETRKFGVLAVIATTRAKVENVNEKPGLQCTRTPHSWKFLYLASGETYELVMTACSTREADQWKDHLLQNISPEITVDTPRIGTKVMFPIKRRPVVTINEAGNMVQPICRLVRIKGTEAIPRLNQTPSMSPSRPQTLLVTPMETLAPNRQTRIRMERWLSDMWTCDIIPYPGMPGRGELFIRSQAGSFFRSLSSRRPFSRRASSIASATTQSIKSHSRAEETDTTTPTSPISNHSTRELDETIDAHPLRSSSPDYTALPQIKCADEMVQHEAPGTSAKYVKEGTKTGKRTRWGVSIFTTPGRSRRTRPVEV
ncbi:hypothetical protein MGYG_00340 [Nannizzia gypsea CBS 118893]|uniref:DH domain-containing protein n=1 Tax=Arthroderma gypseum (strain ATCC MYA-4604 / CBS 118893) TaxID=535722 RepID=E5QZ67_ARTGP|nr:hypothetical protein MGYG_00340 [Nannizzia gypsea CBS 118893]EFQ97299.1 hypothetical protein MGYG_00340 [Nannizzia gypsea CBS 118893]